MSKENTNEISVEKEDEDILTKKISSSLHTIYLQGLAVGGKSVATVVLEKIATCTDKSSKRDLARSIKQVEKICNQAIGMSAPDIEKVNYQLP